MAFYLILLVFVTLIIFSLSRFQNFDFLLSQFYRTFLCNIKRGERCINMLLILKYINCLFFSERDVRRLVVAMSRARLGLYIFARVSLFQNCFELTPAFSQLTARPLHLHIIPTEPFPTTRKVGLLFAWHLKLSYK